MTRPASEEWLDSKKGSPERNNTLSGIKPTAYQGKYAVKSSTVEESWYSHRSVSSQKWNRQKSPFTDWFCMFCWKAGINPWQKQLFYSAACSSSRQPKSLFTHQSSTTKKKRERSIFSIFCLVYWGFTQTFLYLWLLTKKSSVGVHVSIWMQGGLQRKCPATSKSHAHQKYRMDRIVSSSDRK